MSERRTSAGRVSVGAGVTRPLSRPRPPDPPTDRRMAALHLRLGHLGLARAELEALAGAGELDDDGLLVLAEARWRTGDLTGAGEAAQAYLAAGGETLLGLVIAAEATAALGRPGEARRLAARALERSDAPLDTVFSGMPRSLIWPADPHEAGQPTGTLFTAESAPAAMPPPASPPRPTETRPARPTTDAGFWYADGDDGQPPDPSIELEAARAALERGREPEAAVHLAIALRLGPTLAPAVLDLIGIGSERRPEIELVRGDALRLVGHDREANRAYAAAARALARPLDQATPIPPPHDQP